MASSSRGGFVVVHERRLLMIRRRRSGSSCSCCSVSRRGRHEISGEEFGMKNGHGKVKRRWVVIGILEESGPLQNKKAAGVEVAIIIIIIMW